MTKAKWCIRSLYRPFSEWHHRDIAEFARLLQFDEQGLGFRMKGHNPALTATALASAFQCLWQTLKTLDETVAIGIRADLARLRQLRCNSPPAETASNHP